MISIFKQYKILKEIKLKTEEVNKLMKNLYRHEGKYLEALYEYSNYNDKHLLEYNIKSKIILKDFIDGLKEIGSYTYSESEVYKVKLKKGLISYDDYVYENGIMHMEYIKKISKIKLFVIKGLYFEAIGELINLEHEYDILLKNIYDSLINLI
ncbi:hypothetical protein QJR26_18490 (plasmid) [Clostridium baratii]